MGKSFRFKDETIIQAIDKGSGELLLNSFDKDVELIIRTKKERQFFEKKIGLVKMDKGRFIKIMENKISQMAECLSGEAFKMAIKLMDYISIRDNCLIIADDKKLMLKDIQETLKMSKPTVIKYIKELEKNDIISKLSCDLGKCYFFNPFIARKTNDMILDVYNKFSSTRWNDSMPKDAEMIIWKDKRSKY